MREHEIRERIAQYLRTAAHSALVPALGVSIVAACDERKPCVPVYGAPAQLHQCEGPSGRVLDGAGRGVAASVEVVRIGIDDNAVGARRAQPSEARSIRTDNDGKFRFGPDGPRGNYVLRFDADNFLSKEVQVLDQGCGQELTVTMHPSLAVPSVTKPSHSPRQTKSPPIR